MSNWTEGAVALFVVLAFGVGLALYSDHGLVTDGEDVPETVAVDPEAATRGEALAEAQGCLQCHTIDGSLTATGPTWKGLAGSTRPLTSGEDVVADDSYLFSSIVDPRSQTVEGYEELMPTFYADQLAESQIEDLVEYIKSLAA